MKAQEAGELEYLGSITIEKPIKPAPSMQGGAGLERMGYEDTWQLIDNTGQPTEGEDGAADVLSRLSPGI